MKGFFVQKFRPFQWDDAKAWKAGQVCQQSCQIPTTVLLSAFSACYLDMFPNRNGNSGEKKKKLHFKLLRRVSVSENRWLQWKLPMSVIVPSEALDD